jgi:acyl-CoA hydrolase
MKEKYPGKFAPEEKVFGKINRGDRIFIGTGCGEPQYLVHALVNYVERHPKAFFDAEVLHVWTMGVAPYANETYKSNFRQNSFFIGNDTVREAINKGIADFTPIFLSQVPRLFYRKLVPIDVALIQTSSPDHHGYMSLGVSVDITKAATENATLVIAQVNAHMPRVHGDTFIHLDEVDFIIPHDEPLLEYESQVPDEVAQNIGKYVSQLIEDGDTIQVGYGSLPNAILSNLGSKKHLGVHTELLTDGIVELMKAGVIDNSQKDIHRGKSVATFCMGKAETYDAIHDHPGIEFRSIDYTNDPLVIARNKRMTAINSALQIDLTGQATAESIGWRLYSGIGGQADFMRGAVLSPDHRRRRKDLANRTFPGCRGRRQSDERRCPLCHHGMGHCLSPWEKYPGAGHGFDCHCPSEVSSLADRGGQTVGYDLSRPGLHPREEGGIPRES